MIDVMTVEIGPGSDYLGSRLESFCQKALSAALEGSTIDFENRIVHVDTRSVIDTMRADLGRGQGMSPWAATRLEAIGIAAAERSIGRNLTRATALDVVGAAVRAMARAIHPWWLGNTSASEIETALRLGPRLAKLEAGWLGHVEVVATWIDGDVSRAPGVDAPEEQAAMLMVHISKRARELLTSVEHLIPRTWAMSVAPGGAQVAYLAGDNEPRVLGEVAAILWAMAAAMRLYLDEGGRTTSVAALISEAAPPRPAPPGAAADDVLTSGVEALGITGSRARLASWVDSLAAARAVVADYRESQTGRRDGRCELPERLRRDAELADLAGWIDEWISFGRVDADRYEDMLAALGRLARGRPTT